MWKNNVEIGNVTERAWWIKHTGDDGLLRWFHPSTGWVGEPDQITQPTFQTRGEAYHSLETEATDPEDTTPSTPGSVKVGDTFTNTDINDTPIPVGATVEYTDHGLTHPKNPMTVIRVDKHKAMLCGSLRSEWYGGRGTIRILTLPTPAASVAKVAEGNEQIEWWCPQCKARIAERYTYLLENDRHCRDCDAIVGAPTEASKPVDAASGGAQYRHDDPTSKVVWFGERMVVAHDAANAELFAQELRIQSERIAEDGRHISSLIKQVKAKDDELDRMLASKHAHPSREPPGEAVVANDEDGPLLTLLKHQTDACCGKDHPCSECAARIAASWRISDHARDLAAATERAVDAGRVDQIARDLPAALAAVQEAEDTHKLIMRQGDLLTRTANALKGEPDALCMHSVHDLPEVAAAMVAQLKESREESARLRGALENIIRHNEIVVGGGLIEPTTSHIARLALHPPTVPANTTKPAQEAE